ncbi:MAG: PepSY domain-containing protein [Candidatus Eremiobacteraeota bacterium]|nr:PepSY domain-containing protein [Candidatus Eremiobacteraeota bacterium]
MRLAHEAKVTLLEARAIALRTVPGKIVSQELERERGGSGLRYTFDIKAGETTREVGVDAKSGRLLENIVEGKNRD